MTFDLKAARANIAAYDPRTTSAYYHAQTGTFLYLALNEIERLQNREKWLLEDNEKRAVAQKEQAKRIAELEAFSNMLHRNCESLQERSRKAESTTYKQRAALKKLGQAKRARGKALVEERAKTACLLHPIRLCSLTKEDYQEAREQLRREGLL